MELGLTQARPRALTTGVRLRGPAAACALLGFALPFYLALRGGGYETVLRDEIGVALWWIVLLGALVGVLPAARPSRMQMTALGALVAFAAWTTLGALWSQSAGRTVAELSRLSCYAAVLALAVTTVRVGARRFLLGGVAWAIGLVGILALLSRLHPAWFPANETATFLPGALSRLNYPLNYWNALAAFMAMGIPLMVYFATSARTIAMRIAAAAALPVMAATIYLTFSRGGWIETGAAVVVLLALCDRRLWQLATLLLGAGGGALLIAAIHQRSAIDHGLINTAAGHQGGNELIAVALVVCAGVALLQAALTLLDRQLAATRALERSRAGLLSRPGVRVAGVIAVVCVGVVVFIAAGGPHALSHAWQDFKNPHLNVSAQQASSEGRLFATSGEGRYQMWQSALDAFESKPLGGLGAGTYQFWWASHGSLFAYVINAHSLYLETLAETGIVGIALLVLLLGGGLIGSLMRLRRSRQRSQQAAIIAAIVAFLLAGGVDWVWQIPALPAVLMLLLAAGTARTRSRSRVEQSSRGRTSASVSWARLKARAAWVGLAVLGTAAIVVPMASSISLRSSQAQARQGRTQNALSSARTASHWQPYASEPALQQALVLEQSGNLSAAAVQARKATDQAKTDWRAWLVRSRIEAERGDAKAALAPWSKARSLDPRDPLFRSR